MLSRVAFYHVLRAESKEFITFLNREAFYVAPILNLNLSNGSAAVDDACAPGAVAA